MTQTSTTLTRDVFNSEGNTINYAIAQKMLLINSIMICQVISYDTEKRTCNVVSILNGIMATGTPIAPPTQYEVPIMDIAGNGCGIEIEYAANDIVIVGYNQRDFTGLKNLWNNDPGEPIATSVNFNPNSYRQFNLADGVILGRLSNVAPTIKIKLTSAGIDIESGGEPVTINTTGDLVINCNKATVTATSEIDLAAPTVKIGGIDFATHTHESGTYTAGATPVTGISGTVTP